MKVSTQVECGIIALIDIALNSEGGCVVKVNNISQRNNISAKYLEQILPLLKQSHLINSVKGASGGYVLSRSSDDITLNEIINALDNTILSLSTFNEKLEPTAITAIEECLWQPFTSYLQDYSDKLTLRSLADRYSELKTDTDSFVYSI